MNSRRLASALVAAAATLACAAPAALANPPVASFTVSPDAPTAGQTVTFDASASTADHPPRRSYRWFIDQPPESTNHLPVTSNPVLTQTFSAGTHTVDLVVSDEMCLEPPAGDNCVSSKVRKTITVAAAPGPGPGPGNRQGVPPPVLGETANVDLVKGEVFVSVPSAASAAAGLIGGPWASAFVPGLKGRRFVPLRAARQVPIGSLLDTRKGTVRVVTARNRAAKLQSGKFLGGVFQVLQSRVAKEKGLTELRLKGSSFSRCKSARRGKRRSRRSGVEALGSAGRTIRRLRGSARGRFRTRGRHSAATVRGTVWTVTDRCDGTLTKVARGKVAVTDFRRKKTVLITAGKRYLAKAPR